MAWRWAQHFLKLSLKRCWCVIELAKRPEKLDESQSCTIFAQPRPVKVSRYLLKSYVGSAKCRAVETFRVILHPYKDKECSNTRENIMLICKWNPFKYFIWCCGNVAKIKFMSQRLTFLEAIITRSKFWLNHNYTITLNMLYIITRALTNKHILGSTPVGYEGELQLSQFDLQETYFR